MRRVPISTAKNITKIHPDLRQIILVAMEKNCERLHVVTYGQNLEECNAAAINGNHVKKALGFPENMCNDEPARIKKIKSILLNHLHSDFEYVFGKGEESDYIQEWIKSKLI